MHQRKGVCITFRLGRFLILSNCYIRSEEKPLAPIQLSSVYFRDSLVGEWQQFAASHPNANVSSNLIFGNAFDGFKKSTEFENLIELLKDVSPD